MPGIDFTNDPLLQGRLFSYLDTQKSRLGTANFNQLPINAPKCPMMNFQRDGQMQMEVPVGRGDDVVAAGPGGLLSDVDHQSAAVVDPHDHSRRAGLHIPGDQLPKVRDLKM